MIDLALLIFAAIAGIGWGFALGWFAHDRFRKANPVGIERVAQSAAQQVEMARKDARGEIDRMRELFDERAASDRATIRELTAKIGVPLPSNEPPPPPARALDPKDGLARANGAQMSDEAEEREALMRRGFSAAEAEAIQRGELDSVPPDSLLDQLATGLVARSTAVT